MAVFLLRRLVAGVVQLLAITLVTWVIFFLIADLTGANPAERIAGRNATAAQVAQVAKNLGTDQPYWVQYGRYVWRLAHLNFGYSYDQHRPVSDIVFPAAATTASVVLGAAVLWLSLAIPIGLACALRPRTVVDRGLMALALVGMSLPVFWLAPTIAYVLGYQPTQGRVLGIGLPHPMHLFPIDGYVNLRDDPVGWAYHLILPWFTFAVAYTAIYARYVRALTIEQLGEDYVRTAHAKGASLRHVVMRHVGPNVAPVIVTLLGIDVGTALGGVLFVETVFGLPGLGYVGLSAIQNLDYPLAAGVITFAAVIAVLANTVVDLVHGLLDPRVRLPTT